MSSPSPSQKVGGCGHKLDQYSNSDGCLDDRNKRFGGLGRRNSIEVKAAPAKKSNRMVERVFRRLIEMVDEGEIKFSDDLDPGVFPAKIERSDLLDFQEFYKQRGNKNKNLLHFAVKEPIERAEELHGRIALVKWLLRSCPELFMQKNSNHEEALAYVIAQYNVGINDPAEPDKLTSYNIHKDVAHYFLSEKSLREDCHSILNQIEEQNRSKPHTAIKEMGVDIIKYLNLLDDSTLLVKDHDGNTPLHVALEVQHWKKEEKVAKRVELIERLVERCPGALVIMNRETGFSESMRMSPYRYHQSLCKKYHTTHKTCQSQSCQDVEFVLKGAYMHLHDNKEAIKHLYNGNQRLYSHLDLSELSDVKPPPANFLWNIEDCIGHMNFDTILRYVCLPKHPLLTEQAIEYSRAYYINYSVVFDWLRKKKVRTIIKLRVEDNEDFPHSDETIVSALRGIDVDIWDWVQYDLCCDTIAEAVPKVKEVLLYSTGNKAVLLNWTSEEGLKKLKHLKRVHIQIDLRPSAGAVSLNHKQFIEERLKDVDLKATVDVEIRYPYSPKNNGGRDQATSKTGTDDANQTWGITQLYDLAITNFETLNCRDSWLKCMDRFAGFIQNIPYEAREKAGNPVVKIAIIDDGVSIHEPRFMNSDIGGGISFHTRGKLETSREETFTHHFPSSSGHGTEMVDRVRQVFPKAKLYIARLNVMNGGGGSITITARSAAEAIKWAVMRKVDIISMSWAVEENANNKPDLKAMEDAIDEAHKQNILMFCAAKDGGLGQGVNFGYPKRFNKPVFCIGATTEHGSLSESIASQKEAIDFGFPGENITPLSGDTNKIAGSSIATALAAGLAGLLLYIIHFDKDASIDEREMWRRSLQQHGILKDTLTGMANNQHKYIPVLNFFDLGKRNYWEDGGEAAFYKIVNKIRMYMGSGTTYTP